MQKIADIWRLQAPLLLSVLRFMTGLMILEYGLSKLFSFPKSLSGGEALPPLIYASGLIEFVTGILLVLGLFTRSAAFVVAGEMAVVYFDFFSPRGFWPSSNGGDLAISWCFLMLYISAAGPGQWHVASLLERFSRGHR